VCSFENGNEAFGSLKGGQLLYPLSDCQLYEFVILSSFSIPFGLLLLFIETEFKM
jgi:hypothetical protein